jgi:hypothetical protein
LGRAQPGLFPPFDFPPAAEAGLIARCYGTAKAAPFQSTY